MARITGRGSQSRRGSGLVPGAATASSHREAPLIAADPPVDNTDTYAVVSPDKSDTVTLVANNVDSDGDGKPDIRLVWVKRS